MSDDWITLIPEDPAFVPDPDKQLLARDRFALIANDAEEIQIQVSDQIEFFDCGANFERVACPACGSELAIDWWQDRMDQDHDGGFKLGQYAMPCCGSMQTLHELAYESPQGFGRFSLNAMNAGMEKLDNGSKRAIEDILGTKIRVIHRRI